ncbi:MAG: hypothetical protein MJK10_03865 [Pseudomonadales bacterium]|nr:hypothetical protein [Pseudomonadales bacterium]
MKIFLLLMATMMFAGCNVLNTVGEKTEGIADYIHTLKTKGCDGLSPTAKLFLLGLAKEKISPYPKNGICNPDWVRDVFLDQLGLSEVTNGIYNRPTLLGYSPDSRDGRLDKPEATGLLLDIAEKDSKSTSWLPDRPGIDPEITSLVYASSLKAYSGSGSNTRLLLYASMQGHDKAAGRLNYPRSNGLCSLSSSNVEAQCGLPGSSHWRPG